MGQQLNCLRSTAEVFERRRPSLKLWRRRKMPCTNCMAEYSRARKEGCSKCGYSFCAKCLQKKAVVSSLSPLPISVCDSCFNALTTPGPSNTDGSHHKYRASAGGNWWGDDKLPPPSMRHQYAAEAKNRRRQQTASSSSNLPPAGGEWESLEKRLADLNKDIPPRLDSQQHRQRMEEKRASVEELEERLAALKEVPVELVRKPRLVSVWGRRVVESIRCTEENCNNATIQIFTNDEEDEGEEIQLSDDAKQLLEQTENRMRGRGDAASGGNPNLVPPQSKGGSDLHHDSSASLNSTGNQISSTRTSDSSIVRKVIKESCEATDSESIASSALICPNFEECVKQTLRDAEAAEQEAASFIAKFSKPQSPPSASQDGGDSATPSADTISTRTVGPSSSSTDGHAHTDAPNATTPNKKRTFLQRFLSK